MLGVKLTVLGIIILIVLFAIFVRWDSKMTFKEQAEFKLYKKLPKRLEYLTTIIAIVFLLDIVGDYI